MAAYIFGEIEGIKEGDTFKDRRELNKIGIHSPIQAGIQGNSKDGSPSIVLSGGYIDDYDLGNEIVYTGHGGNDSNTGKQIQDQNWDAPGNKALIISELHGLPVRVTRGHKHKSKFSPKEGYKYGGLYRVTEHFEDIGKDGFKICRFRLEKIEYSESLKTKEEVGNLSQGTDKTTRRSTTVLRVIRDTKLSKEIKQLYNYTCQVCGARLAVRNVAYAEAAHIKPLGKPHNGTDTPDNLLCLCPNHHVMFDKGMFTINDDLKLVGIDGELTMHKKHSIETTNLKYHKSHVFIGQMEK